MGWRGTIRTIAAAQRRAERNSERKRKDLLAQVKQAQKLTEQALAELEVAQYENLIEVLTSVHRSCSNTWEWNKIKEIQKPEEPKLLNTNERNARRELDQYKPGLFDKLFNKNKKAELEAEVEKAKRLDQRQHQEARNQFMGDLNSWLRIQQIADGIIASDTQAFLDAVNETAPFSDLFDLGSSIDYRFPSTWFVEARLYVNSEKVIPSQSKALLKTGKVSAKDLTTSKFYELYQDYVCSCTLRAAYEFCALLPIQTVFVHVIGELLNKQTGHKEPQPIISTAIPRQTLYSLNADQIDPSDAMKNFIHNMKFTKTGGFSAVELLDPARFAGS